jgi:cytochrome b involved in lipid metabolism
MQLFLIGYADGNFAGKDATQDFEEVGHSNSAKKLLEKYLIGTYEVRHSSGRNVWQNMWLLLLPGPSRGFR